MKFVLNYLTNIHMKEFFFSVIFVVKISQKQKKNFLDKKKMNLLEWLQNLKQHSTPIGAFCGKKFDHES